MKVKEQELKLLINQEGFNTLFKNHPPIKKLKQTNYYFDTENLCLNNLGITLRIREENNNITVCIKSKLDKTQFVTSQEVEVKTSWEIKELCVVNPNKIINLFPENTQNDLLTQLQNEDLKFLGSIHNLRHCINWIDKFKFDLDKTVFPNGEETYELEVEGVSTEKDCLDIKSVLDDKQIFYLVNNFSKYERFLKSIGKQ